MGTVVALDSLLAAQTLWHAGRASAAALGERIAIAPQYLRSAPREYAASFVQAP